MSAQHFGDRLAAAIAARGPLCVGLDPYPERIPALFGAPGPAAAEAFLDAVIARCVGRAAAVKPQIALFERWGPQGLAALARLTERAAEAGLIVILDAKRGDIGATAQGYAAAYLGPEAWLHADAITLNPYMGRDSLQPFLEAADAGGKGAAVLVRTSNSGAADLQALAVQGRPLWLRVAEMLAPLVEARRGRSGWSSLMAVMGATAPDEARMLRAALPAAPFLVPGFGAQGAGPADALAGAIHKDGRLQGALVNASRAVLYPDAASAASDLAAWGRAFEAGLAALQDSLVHAGRA